MDEHVIFLSLDNEQLYKTSHSAPAPAGIVKSRQKLTSGGRMQISKTEKILIILFFAATWAVLALNAGGPIFSDEFLYIDAGLRNFPVPNYGNRYFHIYLQKLFMALAPTPLQGVRCFWGFLIAATAVLIYFNARTFVRKSSALHGLLALAIFFSLSADHRILRRTRGGHHRHGHGHPVCQRLPLRAEKPGQEKNSRYRAGRVGVHCF